MTVGERIYNLRTKANMTQKDFANKIGVAQSSVNYWENGNREPKLNQLKKIANAFGCSISDLIGLTDAVYEAKREFGIKLPKEVDGSLEKYLKSLGYNVECSIFQKSIKSDYINFELTEEEKEMSDKYGCVVRILCEYFISNGEEKYHLSKDEFEEMESEINKAIEFQLWKYKCDTIPNKKIDSANNAE